MSEQIIYTKKIGQWLSFAARQGIVRINGDNYRYTDIVDYKCFEEHETIQVYDYLKVFAAKEANKYIKAPNEEDLTKSVEGLKTLKIVFKLKNKQELTVDFIDKVEERIVIGSHQYCFYKEAYEDAKKSLAIMMKGQHHGK